VPDAIGERAIYVIDGRGQSVQELNSALVAFETTADHDELRVSPLSALR
jgi:hypothetical protein